MDAHRIVDRWQRLKLDRSTHEGVWQEIAEYLAPLARRVSGGDAHAGRHGANEKCSNSTPLIAADNFTGGIYSMMTNPANRWLALKLEDDDLNEYAPARDWLYAVETRVLNSFGPQISRFYNVIPALYGDLACFGNAVFSSEEVFVGRAAHPGPHACARRYLHRRECARRRRHRLSPLHGRSAQRAQMFGDRLSRAAQKAAKQDPFKTLEFIHCVEPANGERERRIRSRRLTSRSMRASWWRAAVTPRCPIKCRVGRRRAARSTAGASANPLLADVKMLNRMDRTTIRAAEKLADPPLLAGDEGVVKAARTYSGGVTYGAHRFRRQPVDQAALHRRQRVGRVRDDGGAAQHDPRRILFLPAPACRLAEHDGDGMAGQAGREAAADGAEPGAHSVGVSLAA